MMKLFHDVKQFIILAMCALCAAGFPLAASAHSIPQNSAQTQQMDKSNQDGSDTSKGDNPPPKPPPKPGPRDGGADD
jgi:hypothetical protein